MSTLGYPEGNSEMPRSRMPVADRANAYCGRCGAIVETRAVATCADCKDDVALIRVSLKKFPPLARCS
jgi:hypothetical protein